MRFAILVSALVFVGCQPRTDGPVLDQAVETTPDESFLIESRQP